VSDVFHRKLDLIIVPYGREDYTPISETTIMTKALEKASGKSEFPTRTEEKERVNMVNGLLTDIAVLLCSRCGHKFCHHRVLKRQ
jgi:hypothetical protein